MISSNEEFYIKQLDRNDAALMQQLILLFGEVFDNERPATAEVPYLTELLQNPDFIVYVAVSESQVVGGLTAYQLPMYYSQRAEMFIYDIGVKPALQRKGIGKMLICRLKQYCREKGIGEMFVAASEEDTHAVDFYKATGGKAERVVHFTYTMDK